MSTLPILTTSSNISSYNIQRTQNALDLQDSYISGELGGPSYKNTSDVSLYLKGLEDAASLNQEAKDNAYLLIRQNHMTSLMTKAQDIAVQLSASILQQTSLTPLPLQVFQSNIRNLMQELTGVLNLQVNGEYLLSGTLIQTAPVIDLSTLGGLTSGSASPSAYYQGGTGNVTVQLDRSSSIDKYPVTANDQAIQQIVLAAQLCLGATISNDPVLQEAHGAIKQAIDTFFPQSVANCTFVENKIQLSIDSVPETLISLQKIIEEASGDIDSFDALKNRANLQALQDMQHHLAINMIRQTQKLAESYANLT
jgi:hypothetical protein